MKKSMGSFQIQAKPERSDRIENLYQHITASKQGVCVERAKIMTDFYRKNKNLTRFKRRAKAMQQVLNNMSIYIMPGSLLVGNQACKPCWAPLFPEFDTVWMEQEILNGNPYFLDERPSDKYILPQESKPVVSDALEYWRGQTHTDRLVARLPQEALTTHMEIKAADIGAYFQGGDGHFSPHHEWLFEHGLQYIINDCQKRLAEMDWFSERPAQKQDFYESIIISCQSVIAYAERYAQLAEEMAQREQDEKRKDELKEIARICYKVPRYAADSFHEALQFIFFIHTVIQIEDNGAGISVGRYDKIMQPLYEKGIADGTLTRALALDLTENFYLMIYSLNKVRSWVDTDFFRGVPMFQNLTIGGQDPGTHEDSTNELSYIALEATANTRVPQPSLTVRFHKGTPRAFKLKVAEVIRLGMGLPSIFNDEVNIPAIMNAGYEEADAYDYCIIGCVEPFPSGLVGGRTGGAWLNCTKILEIALNNGKDPRSGITLHKNGSGMDLSEFSSFEDVKEAYIDQLNYYIKMEAILENTIDQCWEEEIDEPMAAVFGCPTTTIPRALSIKQGGAKYDYIGQQTIGTANVANSLYAVKHLVFDKKLITGAQLLHALHTDYKDDTTNPMGREIQAMCLSAPKYGNDIDEVDLLAREMLTYAAKTLRKVKNTRFGRGPIGGTINCSTSTVSSNTPFGKVCGATPDGRNAWVAVADGQSPMKGTDKKGPTAAAKSVAKIENTLLADGSLFNMKLVPEDLR